MRTISVGVRAALVIGLLVAILAGARGGAGGIGLRPDTAVAAGAGSAEVISGVPASCSPGDSWCAYCNDHPGADVCSQTPPAPAPAAPGQPSSAGWAAQLSSATNPGSAIVAAIYSSAVAAAQNTHAGLPGVSWTWCGSAGWVGWTDVKTAPHC